MKYVYKIISALCAIAVLPALVFAPYMYYYVSSTALQGIFTIGELMGSQTIINAMDEFGLTEAPKGIADSLSIYKLKDIVSLLSNGNSSSDILPHRYPSPAVLAPIGYPERKAITKG